MLLVGITGGVASGKSVVRKMFEELGAEGLDADEICHRNLDRMREVIREEFGEEFVDKEGRIDRRRLGRLIFQDEKARKRLESLLHPFVEKKLQEVKKRYKDKDVVVVCEIPLLFEVGWEDKFDCIIVVIRDEDKRREFLKREMGLTDEEIEGRFSAQLPLSEKEKKAHWVIDNNGSLEDTRIQVKKIWDRLIKGRIKKEESDGRIYYQ